MTTPVSRLVLRKTRPLAHSAKWTLRAMFLLGVIVALASRATAAPVVFEASGEFENSPTFGYGVELAGTVTIDTATGKVLSADLSLVEGSVVKYVFDGPVSVLRGTGPYTVIVIHDLTAQGLTSLEITLPGASLVEYDGSKIVPSNTEETSGVYLPSGNLYGIDFVPLLTGSLEPE